MWCRHSRMPVIKDSNWFAKQLQGYYFLFSSAKQMLAANGLEEEEGAGAYKLQLKGYPERLGLFEVFSYYECLLQREISANLMKNWPNVTDFVTVSVDDIASTDPADIVRSARNLALEIGKIEKGFTFTQRFALERIAQGVSTRWPLTATHNLSDLLVAIERDIAHFKTIGNVAQQNGAGLNHPYSKIVQKHEKLQEQLYFHVNEPAFAAKVQHAMTTFWKSASNSGILVDFASHKEFADLLGLFGTWNSLAEDIWNESKLSDEKKDKLTTTVEILIKGADEAVNREMRLFFRTAIPHTLLEKHEPLKKLLDREAKAYSVVVTIEKEENKPKQEPEQLKQEPPTNPNFEESLAKLGKVKTDQHYKSMKKAFEAKAKETLSHGNELSLKLVGQMSLAGRKLLVYNFAGKPTVEQILTNIR